MCIILCIIMPSCHIEYIKVHYTTQLYMRANICCCLRPGTTRNAAHVTNNYNNNKMEKRSKTKIIENKRKNETFKFIIMRQCPLLDLSAYLYTFFFFPATSQHHIYFSSWYIRTNCQWIMLWYQFCFFVFAFLVTEVVGVMNVYMIFVLRINNRV